MYSYSLFITYFYFIFIYIIYGLIFKIILYYGGASLSSRVYIVACYVLIIIFVFLSQRLAVPLKEFWGIFLLPLRLREI